MADGAVQGTGGAINIFGLLSMDFHIKHSRLRHTILPVTPISIEDAQDGLGCSGAYPAVDDIRTTRTRARR